VTESQVREIATRHGVSTPTVVALAEGLRRGGGRAIQFDIPELGGMGQWMPGMVMVGAMNDHALKARVDALCTELAKVLPPEEPGVAATARPARWWPEALGEPDAVGGQNDAHYAYFGATNRLAVRQKDRVIVYDSTGHRIQGFSQQQSGNVGVLVFTGDRGPVPLDSLPVVE
jgi:hypothetical protein